MPNTKRQKTQKWFAAACINWPAAPKWLWVGVSAVPLSFIYRFSRSQITSRSSRRLAGAWVGNLSHFQFPYLGSEFGAGILVNKSQDLAVIGNRQCVGPL